MLTFKPTFLVLCGLSIIAPLVLPPPQPQDYSPPGSFATLLCCCGLPLVLFPVVLTAVLLFSPCWLTGIPLLGPEQVATCKISDVLVVIFFMARAGLDLRGPYCQGLSREPARTLLFFKWLYSAQCKWVHPLWKVPFKQYLNEHKNNFQNVEYIYKFNITSVKLITLK